MIDHDALLAAIDRQKESAYGSDQGTTLGDLRSKAIEYYLGVNTNPAPEGRSQVVSTDVFQTVQTVLPSLVRIFAASSENVCKLVPVGPDDEQAAELATAALTHVVQSQNNWEQIAADWIHDALLLPGNAYAMAYWDERDTTTREKYDGQSDDQLAALLADKSVKVLQHSEYVDEQATADQQAQYQARMEQYAQMAQMAQMQGQQIPPAPPPPPPVLLHDVVIERREADGYVCIKTLPPEHCYISGDTPDWTLKECPYFEYRREMTIGALRAMGLDVPEDVSDDEDDTPEDSARDRFGEADGDDAPGVSRKVWARMIWVRADAEKDQQERLYHVIAVGRTVLYAEPCARIPVASMTPQPLPHRHPGMSLAEVVFTTQDIKTALKRGALDNLTLVNRPRIGISSRVNLDDMLTATPGGVIRMNDDSLPSEGHFFPITHPFAFEQIVGSIEYFDQENQNNTGASRYFSGTDAGALNKTAAGTSMLQNAAATRVEHIARMMAPAVEGLFSIAWETWSKHANKSLTIKLKGKWATIDPQAWRTKRDVRISVGVGAGNKESMLAQLNQQLAMQMQIGVPMGLAAREEVHATAVEIAKLGGFANPGRFWKDPETLPPQQQPPNPEVIKAQSQMQIEQMRLQADAQKFQAETVQRMREIQMENERKITELRAQLELQATNDARDAEREARNAAVQTQIEAQKLESQRQLEELRLGLEKYKVELEAQTKLAIADKSAAPPIDLTPIQTGIEQMMAQMMAPAEIVRDPQTGRAIGVKKGDVVRQIKRGPDGRAMGLQ